jgi:hypothetical protein
MSSATKKATKTPEAGSTKHGTKFDIDKYGALGRFKIMSANRVYYNCNLICVLLLLMTVD